MPEEIPRALWPRRGPVASFMSVLLSLTVIPFVLAAQQQSWSPLRQFYLSSYIRSAILPGRQSFPVLYMRGSGEPRFALDAWVAKVPAGVNVPPGRLALMLTAEGRQYGGEWLQIVNVKGIDSSIFHRGLREWIYGGQSLADLFRLPATSSCLSLLALLPLGIRVDRRRYREQRLGKKIRGPDLITPRQFNRRVRGDGLAFVLASKANVVTRLARKRAPVIRLRAADEASHALIIGDTGSGKSSLIRQVLRQVRDRGQVAVVHDPHREFAAEFFDAERGDWILNPIDVRCPFWRPGAEIRHEAQALTIAASLFPDQPNEQRFFIESARKVMAHLLTYDPTPAELTRWMEHPEEIDVRTKGTELESLLAQSAPGQRAGVLGTLNQTANAFRLLPESPEGRRTWSVTEWSKRREGWIFVTNTQDTREALRPLQSLWLDLIILRLLSQGRDENLQPVWIILDELASLQKLPQLHTAITENRKTDNRLVLSFQGKSQLDKRYGQDAETILSQPFTKVLLRTSEPRAAEWMSKAIGDIELERVRETRSNGLGSRHGRSYTHERKIEPLVLPAQIEGLNALQGYLRLGNYVVLIEFPYVAPDNVTQALIERDMPVLRRRTVPPAHPPSATDAAGPAVPLDLGGLGGRRQQTRAATELRESSAARSKREATDQRALEFEPRPEESTAASEEQERHDANESETLYGL